MEKIKFPFDATFQSFFNASIDFICVIDTHGYFRYVNPVYFNPVGYTKEGFLTRWLYRREISMFTHKEKKDSIFTKTLQFI
jgi:PAS domain S-box-containing protein